jgi:predicted ATPase/DNA-binding winged helix-turn-helix (wHTH) protein
LDPLEQEVGFGPFRLVFGRKLLLRDCEAVAIGHRALDLLIALVRRAGEVVGTAELLAEVWPGRHVSDANIRTQISLLRKALGEGESDQRYIVNVAGRGYCFVAPPNPPAPIAIDRAPASVPIWPGTLPKRLTSVVGRATGMAALAEQVLARRLVTITGAGGIGKTTVATAVAEMLSEDFASPPCFVDFGPLTDGALAAATVARALGAPPATGDTGASLGGFVRERHLLLLFDSCETVISEAALIAEAILKNAPRVHILATSREPLSAEGEWTHRLPPMQSPLPGTELTAAAAMAFPAVALFVERATARQDSFRLTKENVSLVAEICRRLEGIPLAIELAATRVAHLGLRDLAERLDERFALLMRGRRTALPRHQTLQATLDWSYQLLAPQQQVALRRMAVFPGPFTRDAALALCAQDGHSEEEVLEMLGELLDKSLIIPDPDEPGATYRLLDTTRAYLRGKLAAGEGAATARSHAVYFRDLLSRGRALWEELDLGEAQRTARRDLDSVRAALDWSFGPDGDAEIGIELAVAAIPIWLHFSLFDEGRTRVQQALDALGPETAGDAPTRMLLLAALGEMILHRAGPEQDEVWARLLAVAEQQEDVGHQLRALTGMTLRAMGRSYDRALDLARKVRALAEHAGPEAVAKGDRLIGYVLHILGEQRGARRAMESMLAGYVQPRNRRHLLRFNFDDSVGAKSTLAQILWLQGEADRAMRLANEAVEEAVSLQHDNSVHFAAGFAACPIAVLRGDLGDAAAAYDQMCGPLSNSPPRALWAQCFAGIAQMQSGALEEGLGLLRRAFDSMAQSSFGRECPVFYSAAAEGLIHLSRGAEALGIVDAALQRFRARGNRWFEAEFMRLRACALLVARGVGSAGDAETELREALELARGQGALAWELRAATSLAALLRDQGRHEAARPLLENVLRQFTDGFGTVDLVRGRALLGRLTAGA